MAPNPVPTSRSWLPDYRCLWCGSAFLQRHVDYVEAWTCPTERCYQRQLRWKILDAGRKLFYLPIPRLVEVEEAVASQQYGAICLGGDRSGGKSVGLRSLIYRYCMKIENFSAGFPGPRPQSQKSSPPTSTA